MKPARVLPCLLLLLAPAVLAASVEAEDPAGDESVKFHLLDLTDALGKECSAPAVDVLTADAETDGTDLRVRIHVADPEAPIACPYFREDFANRSWSSAFYFDVPDYTFPAPIYTFSARWSHPPGQAEPHVWARLWLVANDHLWICEMPAEGGVEDNVLTAKIPLRGTARCGDQSHAYDLTGPTYEAVAFVEAEGFVHSDSPLGRRVFGRYFAEDWSRPFAFSA